MNANSIFVRGAVLLMSAALAMPFVTHAAGIIGGDDVPPCDTWVIGDQNCAIKSGVEGEGNCDIEKTQCVGCGSGEKSIKCASQAAECMATDCLPDQTQGYDPGKTCIAEDC